MSNLTKHAERELVRAGFTLDGSDDIPDSIGDDVLALIKLFGSQGHSGGSVPIIIELFRLLARFKPLSPLTGSDDEWMEVSEGLWQNIRCSRVFKDASKAWDIDGRVFRGPNDACYTSSESRVNVTFPYIPKTEFVDVPERAPEVELTKLKRGQIVVIVGPEGCGKSTLARKIAAHNGTFVEINPGELRGSFDLSRVLENEPDTLIVDGFPDDSETLVMIERIAISNTVLCDRLYQEPKMVKAPNIIFCSGVEKPPLPNTSDDKLCIIRLTKHGYDSSAKVATIQDGWSGEPT